jgi:hypothetical protein
MLQRSSHETKTVLTVFECTACGVVFYTEDHVPITGLPVPELFRQCAAESIALFCGTIRSSYAFMRCKNPLRHLLAGGSNFVDAQGAVARCGK